MAASDSDLVISISTDVATLRRSFKKIEKEIAGLSSGVTQQFNEVGRGIDNSVASSFGRVTKQGKKSAAIIRENRIETGNLAAQFNDIGVQLAGGQSPFLIALQQGTQINQALGGGGLRATVGALGGAFASLLNPVSLATIGVIGLGGVAVQYFTQLLSDGEESAKVLKEQADLIQKVADKWGEAYPAIKAYADEQAKLADQSDLEKATNITVGASYAKIKSDLEAIQQSARDAGNEVLTFGATLEEARNVEPAVAAALDAIDNLEQKTRDGTETADDFNRVLEATEALLGNAVVQATNDASISLETFIGHINRAKQALQNLNFNKNVEAGNLQLPPIDPLGFIDTIRDQNNVANATKSQYQQDQEKLSRHRGGGGKSDAEKQAEAIKRVIDNLKFEGEQLTRTAEDQQVYNQLKAAGVDINTKAGATIADLVRHNYELDEAQKAAKKSQEDFANGIQQLESDAVDALGQVIAGTEDAGDAFKKLAIEIVKSALTGKGAYADLFASIFSGGGSGGSGVGGNPLGAIASGIGHLFGFASGTANTGGARGQPRGLVHGQEAVIPLPAGGKVPVDVRMPQAVGRQSGAQPPSAHITVNVEGANGDQHVISLVRQGVSRGLNTYDKQLTGTFGSRMSRAQQRQI